MKYKKGILVTKDNIDKVISRIESKYLKNNRLLKLDSTIFLNEGVSSKGKYNFDAPKYFFEGTPEYTRELRISKDSIVFPSVKVDCGYLVFFYNWGFIIDNSVFVGDQFNGNEKYLIYRHKITIYNENIDF